MKDSTTECGNQLSDLFDDLQTGVRQGRVLSPALFVLAADRMMKETVTARQRHPVIINVNTRRPGLRRRHNTTLKLPQGRARKDRLTT